ncbi:MAG: hypothetical protein Q4C98_02090 [Capnocytophaga sp.]|nr:hypothetical protein [Capnocytophaga sp.]
MRKILFLLITITTSIVSCSKDSDNETSSSITPPSWIQGTWLGLDGNVGYSFASDDFCQIVGSTNNCHKGHINSGAITNVTQEISDSAYVLNLVYNNSTTFSFRFKKVSDTQIESLNAAGNTDLVLTKK